ncbi:beta strand repeat-containing protein [Pseudomonas mediterranea]|uniref:beta strand repeat-containing protein n=1 Tax=Pseudomonas mediterranea TaxID=183795 RepID=UPI002234AEA2|nr:calcium-binding protein [Pseudomonas mediterranea]UZD99754.1 calcium-binding protein [Pseudomonas mediterranea]
MAVINGTSGADTLVGTTSADQLYGLGGNDSLSGGDGNDWLEGGAGADTLNGGTGIDTASYANSAVGVTVNLITGTGLGGDAQGDTLVAIETVVGSAFNDTLTAQASGHSLQGGAGNDVYVVGGTGVTVYEVADGGNDEVRTTLGNLTLAANVERLTFTGTGNFVGYGNASDNIITGGAGNDFLLGGAGADQFIGGAGTDTVSYTDSNVAVNINAKTGMNSGIAAGDTYVGIETIQGSQNHDSFTASEAADQFDGAGGIDAIDYSTSASAVTVSLVAGSVGIGGDAQGDKLSNFETVVGSSFDDRLTAQTSGHSLRGGAGDDVYVIGGTGVNVIEAAGDGNDEIQTTLLNLTMAANVERLTFTGTGNFVGYGNASDNIITGGAGNDFLLGGAGADQFIGGAGTDTVSYTDSNVAVNINAKTGMNSGIAAGDTYVGIETIQGSQNHDSFTASEAADQFDGTGGIDTIDYSTSASAVTVSLVAGSVGIGGDAQGDKLSNFETVVGSSFDDRLTAQTSGHSLRGGAGDDVYVIGGTGVNVIEAAGDGNDEIQTTLLNLTMAANVERLTFTGTGNFVGYGNASDNIITGGAGNDFLLGGAGADQFIGGAGTDTVSYTDSNVAVNINAKTGMNSGIAAGDTYVGIETIQGSQNHDSFTASEAADQFDGTGGIDTIDYSTSASAVTVSLVAGSVGIGGDAQGDKLSNFETVVGSSFDDRLTAQTSGHSLRGGAGDDVYVIGGTGVNVIEAAGDGNDEIQTTLLNLTMAANVERLTFTGTGNFVGYGNASDNIITGGAGNDFLLGGAGADQFIGGAGTDTVSYTDSNVAVNINAKTGMNSGIAAGDTYVGIETIQGSQNHDSFTASEAADQFDGTGGIDTIDYSTSASAVTVSLVVGSVGIGGDAQGDKLSNFETVVGSSFDDRLTAQTSGHSLRGGAGDDVYVIGGTGVNVIEAAGDGNDEIQTTLLNLTMAANVERLTFTGTGNFVGYGNASDNIITGGAGNDFLLGGAGADQFIGGAGTDTVSYTDSNVAVNINAKTGMNSGIAAGDTYVGIETIQGSQNHDSFTASEAADQFDGTGGIDTIDYSTSASAVTVSLVAGSVGIGGDAQGDKLSNFETVVGSSFDDRLTAQTSGHSLRGGAGDDVYVIGGTGVNVIEAAGDGNDEIQTTLLNLTMAANVERLTFTGTGNFVGYGNASDNIITGGAGNDFLLGGAGADQFIGGAGTDTVSYADSDAGLTINTQTGVHTGIAAGDIYNSIEVITGSNFSDVFVGDAGVNIFNGGAGIDMLSFANESSGITLDLSAPLATGVAAGDSYTSIEVFQGTAQADTFTGSTGAAENFVGGAGADTLTGLGRGDGAWYLTSSDAVQVDLLAGTASGGDAQGDVLVNIDNLIGSQFNDTLTGNAYSNKLEGGAGNDLLYGGDGDDFIYGGTVTDTSALGLTPSTGVEADTLYGGNGNDTMRSSGNDAGSVLYGEAGSDSLTVSSGIAYGGDGNDTLTGTGYAYELHGGAGFDTFNMNASGDAYGGEGGDAYVINSKTMVAIEDTGTSGVDTVTLKNIQSVNDVQVIKTDAGAYIFNAVDYQSGNLDSGVFLKDWYAGGNTIETFFTNNGDSFTIPV